MRVDKIFPLFFFDEKFGPSRMHSRTQSQALSRLASLALFVAGISLWYIYSKIQSRLEIADESSFIRKRPREPGTKDKPKNGRVATARHTDVANQSKKKDESRNPQLPTPQDWIKLDAAEKVPCIWKAKGNISYQIVPRDEVLFIVTRKEIVLIHVFREKHITH